MKRYLILAAAAAVCFAAPGIYAQAAGAPAEQAASAAALGQQGFASLLQSFLVPRVFAWLKRLDSVPWIREGAKRANRVAAVGVSIVQGSGLTWVYHRAGEVGSPDGWQFVLGSKHSSFEEWAMACLVSFAAQQYFYEQLPSTQVESMARAFSVAVDDAVKKIRTVAPPVSGGDV
jgi:hypothetical protein